MSRTAKFFFLNVLVTVIPFAIYTVLYWYPSINFFSYVDNNVFSFLWELPWLQWFIFISAPVTWLLFILMLRDYNKGRREPRAQLMLMIQGLFAVALLVYWVVVLRVMLMV